jgi:hypothetical protein
VETRIGAQENLDEAAEAEPHSPAPAFNEPEARRAFDAGVLMLATILIAGVGLMALILLWGSRARRIARQPLPTVAPRDELWYLKNKKESATATGDDPPTADEASE